MGTHAMSACIKGLAISGWFGTVFWAQHPASVWPTASKRSALPLDQCSQGTSPGQDPELSSGSTQVHRLNVWALLLRIICTPIAYRPYTWLHTSIIIPYYFHLSSRAGSENLRQDNKNTCEPSASRAKGRGVRGWRNIQKLKSVAWYASSNLVNNKIIVCQCPTPGPTSPFQNQHLPLLVGLN